MAKDRKTETQTREEFLAEKPFSMTITMDPRKNRGEDLPDDFGPTTQHYPHLNYQELRSIQRAIVDGLFALGVQPDTTK